MAGEQHFGLTPSSDYFASVDPTVNDDDTQGFAIGSVWANRTGRSVWVCTDNRTGRAVWVGQGAGVSVAIPAPGCAWPILTANASLRPVWALLVFDNSGNLVCDNSGYPVLERCG